MTLASHRGNYVASGIIVLAPVGMGQYTRVRVRSARATGLVCRATRPYVCFTLSPFTIWDDDPYTLLHGMALYITSWDGDPLVLCPMVWAMVLCGHGPGTTADVTQQSEPRWPWSATPRPSPLLRKLTAPRGR